MKADLLGPTEEQRGIRDLAREFALQEILQLAGMASATQAVAVSVVSRLWLLIIQIVPALIFLAYRRPRHEKDPAAG